MVDDDHANRGPRRLQFQPQLIAQGILKGYSRWVGLRLARSIVNGWRELDEKIERSLKPRFVHYRFIQLSGRMSGFVNYLGY